MPSDSASQPHKRSELGWLPWVAAGAAYGIFLRVFFDMLPEFFQGVMSVAFLIVTPLVIGGLTVYGARHNDPKLSYCIIAPWAAIALMMLGCAITLLEGSICIALMTPLFLACGSIGGLAMRYSLKIVKRNSVTLKATALLPLLVIIGEGQGSLDNNEEEIRRAIEINASASVIWNQIIDARAISPTELPFSFAHLIGVPKPIEGVNRVSGNDTIRYSTWEKGVHFKGRVLEQIENKSITWRYKFDEDSFPAGSMDEHVEIGGRYFDLRDTTFNLYGLSESVTRLEVIAHYRVTSSVNFYAVPVARFFGRDFLDMLLGLYKGRSEKASVPEDLAKRMDSAAAEAESGH